MAYPSRRGFITGALAAGAVALLARFMAPGSVAAAFEVTRTAEEWRRILTPRQFAVLREADTEAPFTSPLLHEKRAGVFSCAGCKHALYSSKDKFDSGTGWPSFTRPINDDAVATKPDKMLIFVRTEVHCKRCGGHLGHVFDDGPPPTGKRHCINGLALDFRPA